MKYQKKISRRSGKRYSDVKTVERKSLFLVLLPMGKSDIIHSGIHVGGIVARDFREETEPDIVLSGYD
jgi:hypothetical protein